MLVKGRGGERLPAMDWNYIQRGSKYTKILDGIYCAFPKLNLPVLYSSSRTVSIVNTLYQMLVFFGNISITHKNYGVSKRERTCILTLKATGAFSLTLLLSNPNCTNSSNRRTK